MRFLRSLRSVEMTTRGVFVSHAGMTGESGFGVRLE